VVLEKLGIANVSAEGNWAAWALAQADHIDPTKNGEIIRSVTSSATFDKTSEAEAAAMVLVR
jgi:hypothetical protein